MAFTWNDIQAGDKALNIREQLNTLGDYGAQLIFSRENITIATSDWTSFPQIGYKATAKVQGVKADSVVIVMFSIQDQLSNNYTVGEVGNGTIEIYAINKPNTTFTIPNILVIKGVE